MKHINCVTKPYAPDEVQMILDQIFSFVLELAEAKNKGQ